MVKLCYLVKRKNNIELSVLNTVLTCQFLTNFIHLPLGLKFILATEGRYQLMFSLFPLPHLKYLDSHTLSDLIPN